MQLLAVFNYSLDIVEVASDVDVKLGCSRSNRFCDIHPAHFV